MLALSQLGNGSVAPADPGCLTTTNPAFAPYGVVNCSLAGHTATLGDRPRA
jgi:hypothetical protein